MRGPLYAAGDLDEPRDWGFEILPATSCARSRPRSTAPRARAARRRAGLPLVRHRRARPGLRARHRHARGRGPAPARGDRVHAALAGIPSWASTWWRSRRIRRAGAGARRWWPRTSPTRCSRSGRWQRGTRREAVLREPGHAPPITEVETLGIETIPPEDRTAKPFDLFRVDFGGANTFATVVLGAFPILSSASGSGTALLATLTGIVIGGLILMPMALFGPVTGTNNAVSPARTSASWAGSSAPSSRCWSRSRSSRSPSTPAATSSSARWTSCWDRPAGRAARGPLRLLRLSSCWRSAFTASGSCSRSTRSRW